MKRPSAIMPAGSPSLSILRCLSAQGRQEIYAVHARGKKIAAGLSFERIGRATAGFTGADIMNLMNQAAIQTVREVGAPRGMLRPSLQFLAPSTPQCVTAFAAPCDMLLHFVVSSLPQNSCST